MKKVVLLLVCFSVVICGLATGAPRPEKNLPKPEAELYFSKTEFGAHFLLRIVQHGENQNYYRYYGRNVIQLKDRSDGESISTCTNSHYLQGETAYEIFAWGRVSGAPAEFSKRFKLLVANEKQEIKFDRVEENRIALFICANAESGGKLAGVPAFKKLMAEFSDQESKWYFLHGYLNSGRGGPPIRRQGANLDLYSVFTGISAIRETLQSDVQIESGNSRNSRVCHSNLRTIQNAVELYNIDHNNGLKELDLKMLRDEKYLYHQVDCPDSGRYYLNPRGTVRCPIHGDPENPKPDADYAESLKDKVAIKELEGPKAPSHDWKSMLKNRDLKLPGIYKLLPADCAFVHFPSYTAFRKAFDFLDEWATAFGAAFGSDSGNSNFGLEKKIKDQLLLKTDILTRLFADMALSDIVFVCDDPYIFEGTAFAVILKIENEAMLKQKLAMTAADFSRENPQIKEGSLEMSGHKVQTFTSEDYRFGSYRLILEGYQIVCNSPILLQKIINSREKRHASMIDSQDLHYFYEHIEKEFNEKGRIFSFLSDAFIRKLIGPTHKIACKRRLECLRNIVLQQYELLINGKLDSDLKCCEGGEYSYENEEIYCSVHRNFGYMRPVSENLPLEATKSEAEGYRNFVRQYNQYFSQFFDPIGFVFTTEPSFKSRMLIMPLVENGVYAALQQNVKTEAMRVGPTLKTGILKLGANLKVENMPVPLLWRRSPEGSLKAEMVKRWFTGAIWIHMADHPLLLHFDANTFARGMLGSLGGSARRGFGEAGFVPAILSFISPMMFALELTDESCYPQIIALIQRELEDTRKRRGMFLSPDLKLEKLIENDMEMYVLAIDLFALKKTFYFTCRDGFLLLSSQKQLFSQLEDEPAGAKLSGNFNLLFYPERVKQMRSDLIEMRARSQRESCLENLRNLHFINSFRSAESEKYYRLVFGSEPTCPAGGRYRVQHPVACTEHGTIIEGVVKSLPDFFRGVNLISVQSFINSEGFQSEIQFDSDN